MSTDGARPTAEERQRRLRELREEQRLAKSWTAEDKERELRALEHEDRAAQRRMFKSLERARNAAEAEQRRRVEAEVHSRVLAAREAARVHAIEEKLEEEAALVDASRRAELDSVLQSERENAVRLRIAQHEERMASSDARARVDVAQGAIEERTTHAAAAARRAAEASIAEDNVRRLQFEREAREREEERRLRVADEEGARLGTMEAHRERLEERGKDMDGAVRRLLLDTYVKYAPPYTVGMMRTAARRLRVDEDALREKEESHVAELRKLLRARGADDGDAPSEEQQRVEDVAKELEVLRARRDVWRAHALVLLFANAIHERIEKSPRLARAAPGDVALATRARAFAETHRWNADELGGYLQYLRQLLSVAEKHAFPEFQQLFVEDAAGEPPSRDWKTTFGDEEHSDEYATRLLEHMDRSIWSNGLTCPAPGEFELSVAQRTVDYVYGPEGPPMRRKITMRRPGMGKTMEMLIFFRNATLGKEHAQWPPMLLAHAQDNLERNFKRELDAFASSLGLDGGLPTHIQYLDFRSSTGDLRGALQGRLQRHFTDPEAFIAVDEAHHMVALGEEYRRSRNGSSDPHKVVNAWHFSEAVRAAPARNVLLASGSILSDDVALLRDEQLGRLVPLIDYEKNKEVRTYTALSRSMLDIVTRAPIAHGTLWRRVQPGYLGMGAEEAQDLSEFRDFEGLAAHLNRVIAEDKPLKIVGDLKMPTKAGTNSFAFALARYKLVKHREVYFASDDNYDTAIFYAMLLGNATVFAPMVPALSTWELPNRAGPADSVIGPDGTLSGINLVLSGSYDARDVTNAADRALFEGVIRSLNTTVDKAACTVYTSIPRRMTRGTGKLVDMRHLVHLVQRMPRAVVPKLESVAHVILALHHRFRREPGARPPRQMLMMSATRGLGWINGKSLFEYVLDATATKAEFRGGPPLRYFSDMAYLLQDADGDEAVKRFDMRFNAHCAVASAADANQLLPADFDELLGAPTGCCVACRLLVPSTEGLCDVDPWHRLHPHCAAHVKGLDAPATGCALCALLARCNADGAAHVDHVVVVDGGAKAATVHAPTGGGARSGAATLARDAFLLLRKSGKYTRIQLNRLRHPRSIALLDTDTSSEGINVHNVDFTLLAEVSRNGRQELQKRLRGNRYCKNDPGVVNRVLLFRSQQLVSKKDCDGEAIRLLALDYAEQSKRYDALRSISLDRAVFDRLESNASDVLRGENLLDAAFRQSPQLVAYRFALTSSQVRGIWDWLQRLQRECESERERTDRTPCHLSSACPRVLCETRDTVLERSSCGRRMFSLCDGLGEVVTRFFHWFRDLRPDSKLLVNAIERGGALYTKHLSRVLVAHRFVRDRLLRRDAVELLRVNRDEINEAHRVRVAWEVEQLASGGVVSKQHAELLLCGALVAHWVVHGQDVTFLDIHDSLVGALPRLSLQVGVWLFGIGAESHDLGAMSILRGVHTLYESLERTPMHWINSPYQIVLPIVSTALVAVLWARRLATEVLENPQG